MQSAPPRESVSRRQKVACRICGRPIDLVRIRDHLRTDHQVDTSTLEKAYLDARLAAKKARRTRA